MNTNQEFSAQHVCPQIQTAPSKPPGTRYVRVWKPDAALKHPISLLIPNLPSCLSYLIHDYTTGTSQWAWLSVGLRQALDRHSKMFPTAKSFILNIRRAPRNRFKKPILITFTPTSEEYPRAARQVNTSLAHLQHVETRE